jgi:hypothetical protein
MKHDTLRTGKAHWYVLIAAIVALPFFLIDCGGKSSSSSGGGDDTTSSVNPIWLEETTRDSTDPVVAINENGDAVALWGYEDTAGNDWESMVAARFNALNGQWSTPEAIENNSTGGVRSPMIALDDDGNALALWAQGDVLYTGTSINEADLYTTTFTATNGWVDPTPLSSDLSLSLSSPKLIFHPVLGKGGLFYNIKGGNLHSRSYDGIKPDGTGDWGAATDETVTYSVEAAAGDRDERRFMVLWRERCEDNSEFDDKCTGSHPFASLYESSAWGEAVLIDDNNTDGDSRSFTLYSSGMNSSGDLMAVWTETENSDSSKALHARFFDGSSWGTIETLFEGDHTVRTVAISADTSAMVLYDAGGQTQVARAQNGSWEPAQTLSIAARALAMDGTGNAIAAGPADGGGLAVQHYSETGGWGSAKRISTTESVHSYDLAMTPNGKAVLVYKMATGNGFDIQANTYTPAAGWR